MGWRGTVVLLGIVLVTGGYLWLAGPPETEPPADPPTLLGEPRLYDPSEFVALLPVQPAEVVAVRIRHGDKRLSARRDGDRWQSTPAHAPIGEFLRSLGELGRVMEIPVARDSLGDYGFDRPQSVIELTATGQPAPVIVQVGNQNPAGTGVYVRISDEEPVILAGALVSWELDKLFRKLAG